jgi:hypothetical protein
MRVPPFWPEEPEIWFAQVEGQFAISGITADATKFNYVIGQLDSIYAKEVKDVIVSPPAERKYEKLKVELIKRLSASNEKKIKQLLIHEEIGDRKPSQFLRHLRSLAGADVPDDFLKTIWGSRLPRHIQTVLAGQPASSSIEDIADLADRVGDIAAPAPQVAAASHGIPEDVISSLTREIAALRREVHELKTQPGQRSRARSTRRSNSRSRSSQRSQSNYRKFPLCWYHGKFGEQATQCVKPCDFKAGNSMGTR